jgi:hypothetical protein
MIHNRFVIEASRFRINVLVSAVFQYLQGTPTVPFLFTELHARGCSITAMELAHTPFPPEKNGRAGIPYPARYRAMIIANPEAQISNRYYTKLP